MTTVGYGGGRVNVSSSTKYYRMLGSAGKKYLTVKNSQIAKAQPMTTDTLVEYDPILESSLDEKNV